MMMLNSRSTVVANAAARLVNSTRGPLLARYHCGIIRSFAAQSQIEPAPLLSSQPHPPATGGATCAATPAKATFSSNEFPDRHEAPIITRTQSIEHNNYISQKTKRSTNQYSISPTRSIGIERPSHIPPNVPLESLGVPDLELTTLPNGVRVGSIENYSRVSSVGVLLDFGSRHELDRCTLPPNNNNNTGSTDQQVVSTAGVNHLMELMAFQSTQHHTGSDIRNIMEHLGSAYFATSSREQMMYCVDVLRPNVNMAFGLLSETIKCPMLEDVEIEEMKQVIQFQVMDIMPQVLMGEGLQMSGYGPLDQDDGGSQVLQQLGRPHFCTPESLPNLTAQSVHAFREMHLLNRPHGIVVSGSGIAHEALVELANANFGHIISSSDDDTVKNTRTIPSVYTGGEYRLQRPPNPNPAKEEFTHVAIAFEVGGWHSTDLVPTCVLQTLLGGGSSFSAGGPGKGMYSRLHREVLNRFSWAESSEAFTSFHSESGLWGMSGSCKPAHAREMTRVLIDHFLKLENELVTDEELSRARNMLKCNVLTQLESRLVLFEDIGRQILTYGKREDAATMCAKIDAVTKEDIRDVVRNALKKPPTLSTVGIDIGNVPKIEELAQWLGRGLLKKSWF